MAGFAFISEPPFVHIVLQVAPRAFSGRDVIEGLALVAGKATGFSVRPCQRETGFAVVENRGFPVSVVVTS